MLLEPSWVLEHPIIPKQMIRWSTLIRRWRTCWELASWTTRRIRRVVYHCASLPTTTATIRASTWHLMRRNMDGNVGPRCVVRKLVFEASTVLPWLKTPARRWSKLSRGWRFSEVIRRDVQIIGGTWSFRLAIRCSWRSHQLEAPWDSGKKGKLA